MQAKLLRLFLSAICFNVGLAESSQTHTIACLSEEQCRQRYHEDNYSGNFYAASDYPSKGCFSKNSHVYFGKGGTINDMNESNLPGNLVRVSCGKKFVAATASRGQRSRGVMFTMKAANPVKIRGMDIHTLKASNDTKIEIWTKKGSYHGFENSEEDWTLWLDDTIISNELGNPTSIAANENEYLTLLTGERRSFYINTPSGLLCNAKGPLRDTNDDLVLFGNGMVKRRGWQSVVATSTTCSFSGAFYYDLIDTKKSTSTTINGLSSFTNSDYTIGVFYYPWHGRDFHRGEGYLRKQLSPPQLPALGEYDDTDPNTIKQHLIWSRSANINLWVTSWWGPYKREDWITKNVILPHDDLPGTNIALFYETTSRLKMKKNTDPQLQTYNYTFDYIYSDIEYIAATYFDNPNYMRIEGRPVLFVYLTRLLTQIGILKEVITLMRRAALENGGYDLYIIGDEVMDDAPEDGKKYMPFDMLDGVTNYDIYGNLKRPDGYAGLDRLNDLASRNTEWRDETRAHSDCAFIPSVSPGYNDRGVRFDSGHTPLSRKLYEGAPEGSLFRESIRLALSLAEKSTGNLLMINSWNEWHEDTQIEPVVNGGNATELPLNMTCYGNSCKRGLAYEMYGELYLDILRASTSNAQR